MERTKGKNSIPAAVGHIVLANYPGRRLGHRFHHGAYSGRRRLDSYHLYSAAISEKGVRAFPIRDYYENIGFEFGQESYEQLSVQFIATYESRWHECSLHPSARRILEEIAVLGKSQSVLSALDQNTLTRSVQTLEVGHIFDHLVGLDDIYAHSKIEQGRRLLAMLAHRRAEILLIGDTLHDAEVAQAIGIDCVLVAHGHQSKERLQRSGVPVVNSLNELFSAH